MASPSRMQTSYWDQSEPVQRHCPFPYLPRYFVSLLSSAKAQISYAIAAHLHLTGRFFFSSAILGYRGNPSRKRLRGNVATDPNLKMNQTRPQIRTSSSQNLHGPSQPLYWAGVLRLRFHVFGRRGCDKFSWCIEIQSRALRPGQRVALFCHLTWAPT